MILHASMHYVTQFLNCNTCFKLLVLESFFQFKVKRKPFSEVSSFSLFFPLIQTLYRDFVLPGTQCSISLCFSLSGLCQQGSARCIHTGACAGTLIKPKCAAGFLDHILKRFSISFRVSVLFHTQEKQKSFRAKGGQQQKIDKNVVSKACTCFSMQ